MSNTEVKEVGGRTTNAAPPLSIARPTYQCVHVVHPYISSLRPPLTYQYTRPGFFLLASHFSDWWNGLTFLRIIVTGITPYPTVVWHNVSLSCCPPPTHLDRSDVLKRLDVSEHFDFFELFDLLKQTFCCMAYYMGNPS